MSVGVRVDVGGKGNGQGQKERGDDGQRKHGGCIEGPRRAASPKTFSEEEEGAGDKGQKKQKEGEVPPIGEAQEGHVHEV